MAATFYERSGFRPWGGFETNDSMCALPGGFADDQRTPAVPGARAGVVAIYSEIKSPTKHICSTGRIALHLGSRMVSVIDSATRAPRPLPAMWSVRKCWPA
jgi:hypothetical protein